MTSSMRLTGRKFEAWVMMRQPGGASWRRAAQSCLGTKRSRSTKLGMTEIAPLVWKWVAVSRASHALGVVSRSCWRIA
jgi:hypothetical protein